MSKKITVLARASRDDWEKSRTVIRQPSDEEWREEAAREALSQGYDVIVPDTSGVYPGSCLIKFPTMHGGLFAYAFARIQEVEAPKESPIATGDDLGELFEWQSFVGDWGVVSHPPEMSPGFTFIFHSDDDQEPDTYEVAVAEMEAFARTVLRWIVGRRAIAALRQTPPGGFYLHMMERSSDERETPSQEEDDGALEGEGQWRMGPALDIEDLREAEEQGVDPWKAPPEKDEDS